MDCRCVVVRRSSRFWICEETTQKRLERRWSPSSVSNTTKEFRTQRHSLGLLLSPYIEQSGDFPKGQLQVLPVACDVSSEESVEKAFADIVQRFGKVDVSPRVEGWDVGMKLADIYNSVWSILRVWWRTSRLLNVRRLYIFPHQAAILTYHARDRSYRKGQEGEFQCYINR